MLIIKNQTRKFLASGFDSPNPQKGVPQVTTLEALVLYAIQNHFAENLLAFEYYVISLFWRCNYADTG